MDQNLWMFPKQRMKVGVKEQKPPPKKQAWPAINKVSSADTPELSTISKSQMFRS